jgi:mRNA interferase RelE/StbE
MILRFTSKFLKQVSKIDSVRLRNEISIIINEAEKTENLSTLKNIKKLAGFRNHYRIRVGDYRIGLYYSNNILEFAAFDHRKDIYKYFP